MSEEKAPENVVYRFTPTQEQHDIADLSADLALEYAVDSLPRAIGGIVVYGRYARGWVCNPQTRHLVAHLVDELTRLRAIVDKLPVTADGVPVVPGMRVYPLRPLPDDSCVDPPDHGIMVAALRDLNTGEVMWDGVDGFLFELNYSTAEAAALAAQAGGG